MDLPQPPSSTPSLGSDKFLQRAHELKEAGNIELRKGRMLKGHTASKHSLTEACVHYAQGLQQIEMVFFCSFAMPEFFFSSLMRRMVFIISLP